MATGNFAADYSALNNGVPPRLGFPNGKSTTIQGGEPVVLTTASALTTASNKVVRTLLAADIAALYQDGSSNVCGILGFACHDAVTNSSGVANQQHVYSGKSALGEPTFALPSYGLGQPADTNIGYTEIMVWIADPNTVFKGKLISTSTASNLLIGPAGIDLTSGVFTVAPSATTKILDIIAWDPSDTTYVWFTVKAAFCQLQTMFPYTAQ